MTGPAARIPAETPKAVNVRLARETMEPRQTEFMSQGQYSCQRPFPSRVQPEKALSFLGRSRLRDSVPDDHFGRCFAGNAGADLRWRHDPLRAEETTWACSSTMEAWPR